MRRLKYMLFVAFILPYSLTFGFEEPKFIDFEGNTKSIQDFNNPDKWTVLMIWAHNCHICNKEAQSYSFFHEGNESAQILGLSIDGLKQKKKAENFIVSHDLSFPNLLGEPEVVMSYYASLTSSRFIGTPTFMLFSPNGKLMAAQAGAVPPEVIDNYIKQNSK